MTAETAVSNQPSTVNRWENLGPRAKDFVTHVILQPRILKKAYPGVMHFMLMHGVFIQVVGTIINLLNMALFQPWTIEFPRAGWYLGYELVMDIAGVMILIGVGMAAFRRYILRPKSLESNWDDGFALVMLTLIVLVLDQVLGQRGAVGQGHGNLRSSDSGTRGWPAGRLERGW